MTPQVVVSVEEYLHTVYEPDCDYVDGEIIARNMGELNHALTQGILTGVFRDLAKKIPIRIAPELRNHVSATRFRIPDICVMLKSQKVEPVLNSPPFLCVEILSPEDRMSRVLERVKELTAFGVSYIWIIDTETRTAQAHTPGGIHQVDDRLATANPEIAISLREVFAELDEALRVDS